MSPNFAPLGRNFSTYQPNPPHPRRNHLPIIYLNYHHTQDTMSALVSYIEALKLDCAGGDNISPVHSTEDDGDRAAALSATHDIMADLVSNDKLCVERCYAITSTFKAAATNIQIAIDDIEKDSKDTATANKVKALHLKKTNLEQDWKQQVTDSTCANLEQREKCDERVKFVARIARAVGIDVRSAVAEIEEKLNDQSWCEEVNAILEQDSE